MGAALFTGTASAFDGKGISWIAFCGCEHTPCIEYVRVKDDEIVGLTYIDHSVDPDFDVDGCTVYYKAGHDIYEHRVDKWPGSHNGKTIDSGNAGSGDPVASTNPRDSSDPCGCIPGTDPACGSKMGVKLEADQIRNGMYGCQQSGAEPATDGTFSTVDGDDEGDDDTDDENENKNNGKRNGSKNGNGHGKGDDEDDEEDDERGREDEGNEKRESRLSFLFR